MDVDIKEYLSRVGIRKITALVETFGQDEGERHIDRLTGLFDLSEKRPVFGTGGTVNEGTYKAA